MKEETVTVPKTEYVRLKEEYYQDRLEYLKQGHTRYYINPFQDLMAYECLKDARALILS